MNLKPTPANDLFTNTTDDLKRMPRHFWGAERLLLVCLLGLGLVGLVMTYSNRVSQSDSTSRTRTDTLNIEGKARGTHMVLPLNQRPQARPEMVRSATQL